VSNKEESPDSGGSVVLKRTGSNPRESATENIPPCERSQGKGEKAR